MSAQCEVTAKKSAGKEIGFFERYLTVWVFLCIVAGIAIGHYFPAPFQAIGKMEIAKVNMPVAILIWLMIIPMLLKIDFASMHHVKEHWRGVGVTLFINWAVKPFSMALLAWIFIRGFFSDWLPADQIDSYIAGLIILAAAPCTAMVFVWSNLSDGEPNFTLTQVALNDTIMIFACLCTHCGSAAWAVCDYCALGYADAISGSVYRTASHCGTDLAKIYLHE